MTQTSTERAAWQIQASKLEQKRSGSQMRNFERNLKPPPPKKKNGWQTLHAEPSGWLAAPSLTEDPGWQTQALKRKNYEFANLNPEP